MTILEKIIGSPSRLKIIRFFLQNPQRVVTPKELAKMLQISSLAVSRDLAFAKSIELVKKSTRIDEIELRHSRRKLRKKVSRSTTGADRMKIKKKKTTGFIVSQNFALIQPLYNLVIRASPVSREKITQYFKNRKSVKLIALGGVFVREGNFPKNILFNVDIAEKDQSLDLLIVANKIKKNTVEPFIKKIELEVGKELTWALFTEFEFEYRRGMHDKFLRDLFDYPHELLINKLGVE